MPVIVVANPKGGVGKSTLATNIAGWWARQGHAVMLGDTDHQHSARQWLALWPPQAAVIRGREIGEDELVFLAALGQPPVAELRDTQNYVHLAARGLTLWDVAPGRVERDLQQWIPLTQWIGT